MMSINVLCGISAIVNTLAIVALFRSKRLSYNIRIFSVNLAVTDVMASIAGIFVIVVGGNITSDIMADDCLQKLLGIYVITWMYFVSSFMINVHGSWSFCVDIISIPIFGGRCQQKRAHSASMHSSLVDKPWSGSFFWYGKWRTAVFMHQWQTQRRDHPFWTATFKASIHRLHKFVHTSYEYLHVLGNYTAHLEKKEKHYISTVSTQHWWNCWLSRWRTLSYTDHTIWQQSSLG